MGWDGCLDMSVLVITDDQAETRAWQAFYYWIQEGKLVQDFKLLFKPLTHGCKYVGIVVLIQSVRWDVNVEKGRNEKEKSP